MYTLIRSVPFRQLLVQQVPALSISFVISEVFYKFKSFTLECIAFLATWFVVDLAIRAMTDAVAARKTQR